MIEITGGFVNNSIIDNTSRSDRQVLYRHPARWGRLWNARSPATILSAERYITLFTRERRSPWAQQINSAPSGTGAFPLPAGWTALPNLGTVIEDNTIEDSLGGIFIGVQHGANYWGSVPSASASETGRVFLTASVIDNTFEFDSSFLSSWAAAYVADGNDPPELHSSDHHDRQRIQRGSARAVRSPRFPWTVGNALTVNGNDTPIFVDPTENMVTVQSNSVETIGANGSVTPDSGLSGQVYAAIVNGVTVAPTLSPETYNNEPYYPFNLDNLDISRLPPPSPTPTPTPTRPNRPLHADSDANPTPTPTPTPTPITAVPSPPPRRRTECRTSA